MKRCLITGGTGFVGSRLVASLAAANYEVAIVTRSPRGTAPFGRHVSYIVGDVTQRGPWQENVAQYDVLINLAGETIFQRWTAETKRRIRESRILGTRHLVEALPESGPQQRVLLSGSAVGYYGAGDEKEISEEVGPGNDFLAQVAQDWEAEATKARAKGARVVLCRLGIVMGRDGGALSKMLPLFKWGLGSPLGSGRQWFPWIHIDDLVRSFQFLIDRSDIQGPLNCTAPHPVRNEEMTRMLAGVVRRPVFLPRVPGWLIRCAFGEFGMVLLSGQKVLPKRLLESGFRFNFPTFEAAAKDLTR